MKHHTKEKGDVGVIKIMSDLIDNEFMILNPFTEHSPFDLVAYKDSKFYRIQVKYRTVNKKGLLEIPFKTSWADKNGSHVNYYDLNEIDIFAVYCPDNKECYYIKPDKDKKSIFLRVKEPKCSKKIKNINFAKDYKNMPV